MRKFLILCVAAAALGLFAVTAPANAATRKAQAATAGQAVQIDLSARRKTRRYVYRYYRPPVHYRYYFGRPYYANPYFYSPRIYPYYNPYGHYYYYRRPRVYFGFGLF